MLHAGLRVRGVDLLVTPDTVQAVLGVVHEGADLAQIEVIQLGKLGGYLLEMAVYYLSLAQKLLILLVSHVFAFDFLPALDFVEVADDATELVFFEVRLFERVSALAKRSLQTCL